MFKLIDPPLREQIRTVNWHGVVFWVMVFVGVYLWPTEGR